jgi:3-oxoacyl-[acyl-carrier protein] reductase
MSGAFAGRTVLVTGAAHGFGRAIAAAFARGGASVVAADVNEAGLAETLAHCEPGARALRLDVADREAVQAVFRELERSGVVPDTLVNNAGGVLGQVGRPIEAISGEDWNAIFAVNLSGAFFATQAAAPAMKRAGFGRIVNISSGAGLGISLTGIQAYASAKAGQIGLTRQLAHELGPFGITVNNVAPGFVRSNPTTERQWEAMGAEGQERLIANIALRRLGTPDDIAEAVLFFASLQAGWITGQILSVDGGK